MIPHTFKSFQIICFELHHHYKPNFLNRKLWPGTKIANNINFCEFPIKVFVLIAPNNFIISKYLWERLNIRQCERWNGCVASNNENTCAMHNEQWTPCCNCFLCETKVFGAKILSLMLAIQHCSLFLFAICEDHWNIQR